MKGSEYWGFKDANKECNAIMVDAENYNTTLAIKPCTDMKEAICLF